MKLFDIKKVHGLFVACALSLVVPLTSCEDILETDSDFVMYEKENTLDHATDSVYSVLGIISKMQTIADRIVLLGDVRSDLVTTTEAASTDLKQLAAFENTEANAYNVPSDYYAVINNCNYFLAHVDTMLERRGYKVFQSEYAAVKAFRAWTYLELAKVYGSVPLILEPMMTEIQAREAMNGPRWTLEDICNYFIADLAPYVGVNLPDFGSINGRSSQYFFIPMRALLGDLCLWAGRYQDAVVWYHDYLTDRDEPVGILTLRSTWTNPTEFRAPSFGYMGSSDYISCIPMETRVFNGMVSELIDIYSSTTDNYYYFQLTASRALLNLSAAQNYCMEYRTNETVDTIYAPKTGLLLNRYAGDLRFCTVFGQSSYKQEDEFSEYGSTVQAVDKHYSNLVVTYRAAMLYLRYAEALNRAGYPQSAFVILKHGACDEYFTEYVDSVERKQVGNLIAFDSNIFPKERALGIHSYGSGDSQIDTTYVLPQPAERLASRADTVNWQIPLVEDIIINEMALEGMFEGYRYYDLMRVAKRRGDNAYLADPISQRNGEVDAALRDKLMNSENWYLPLP